MKRSCFLVLFLASVFTAEDFTRLNLRPSGCQIVVDKPEVVSKGIASEIVVRVEKHEAHDDISVNIESFGNYSKSMGLREGYTREFFTEITTQKLGNNHFNICVTGCSECKEIALYSIPAPLTLLPPILTVILAILTRQVLLSLSCGVFSAAMISSAYNPVDALVETFNSYIILPFLDPGKAGVLVFSCIMAGLIEILEKTGGAKGFANKMFNLATSVYHASILTVTVCFAFFFDDFASIMIAGKSLGPLVSQLGLSVQKFSLIVHTMAVVVASLCPLSSWAGIQIGYIESSFALAGMEVSGFSYLVQSIPYRFFAVSSLLGVVVYVVLDKDIAPMITYEEALAEENEQPEDLESKHTIQEESLEEKEKEEEEDGDKIPERWYNAIVPLVTLVAISLLRMYYDGKAAIEASEDGMGITFLNCVSRCNSINCLIVGTSVSLLLTLVMIPAQRIMGISKCLEHFVEGVKSMSEPMMILILAWALGIAMNNIHTSQFIALALGDNMPVEYFPALVCVIGYAMSYSSGSSLGTQGIIFPLVIPVIVTLTSEEDIYIKTIAAAFSSSVFGNLCSPIADTTIAGVLFTGCPMLDHIKVMTTFCLPMAALSLIFGDLLVGLELYPYWLSYLIVIAILVVVMLVFGRSPGRRSFLQRLRGMPRWKSSDSSESSDGSSSTNENTHLLSKPE